MYARNRRREGLRRGVMVLCGATAALTGCPPGDPPPVSDLKVGVQRVAQNLGAPVALEFSPDDSGRLFVVSQAGLVQVIGADSNPLDPPFLDIRDRIVTPSGQFDERGLLGLAFHPDFKSNGRFCVFYSAPNAAASMDVNCVSTISEFRVRADDRNLADAGSETVLLAVSKPQANHNGGQLAFGPDRFLYAGFGDGGGAGDAGPGHTVDLGNAQDKTTLLGKIIRIDVEGDDFPDDGRRNYRIPPDNPFVSDASARPEIWALGFRNPWRFSFDGERLFAGDVGQALVEEVDIVMRGGNYGWRVREGDVCLDQGNLSSPLADCASSAADGAPFQPPILTYGHPEGTSVIGGFVYHGEAIAGLRDRYVFGDLNQGFSGGRIFVATQAADGGWSFEELLLRGRDNGRLGLFVYAFGRDPAGEIYVLATPLGSPGANAGEIYRLIPAE